MSPLPPDARGAGIQPAPPSEPHGARPARRGWPRIVLVARIGVVVSWLAGLLAWVLILTYDTESVVGTGPVILGIGIGLSLAGGLTRYWSALLLGAGDAAIVILFVALVNLFAWGPDQATRPFLVMGFIYLLASAPVCLWAVLRPPVIHQPWECEACGYPLFGLSTTACPECGKPFDPNKVSAARPFQAPR